MNQVRILSPLYTKGGLRLQDTKASFSENPSLSQIEVVNGIPYIFTNIGGTATWFPMAQRQRTYIHVQGVIASTWTVSHNLGTNDLVVIVYDENNIVQEANIVFTTEHTLDVVLTEAKKGKVIIFAADSLTVPSVTADHFTAATMNIGSGKLVVNSTGVLIGGVDVINSLNNLQTSITNEVIRSTNEDSNLQTLITANTNSINTEIARLDTTNTTVSTHITKFDSMFSKSGSNILFHGNLLPATTNSYSIGDPQHVIKDLFVSANTIHLGDNTTVSGTSISIDAGDSPSSLTDMPTLMASKLVARPFSYNPGGGTVTVRPSIEFVDESGISNPISFNSATSTFSLDKQGNYGEGSLVGKHAGLQTITTTGLARFDGNVNLGYDSNSVVTVRGTLDVQTPITFGQAATLGDGNDTITINSGLGNDFLINAKNIQLDTAGNLTVASIGGVVVSTLKSRVDNIEATMSSDAERLAAIQTLTDAFTAADTDLNSAITNLGSTLQANIDSEVNARTVADSGLASRLNVIEGVGEGSISKALSDAKAYTDSEVATVASTANSALAGTTQNASAISLETSNRTSAVNNLQSQIDNVLSGTAADSTLFDGLSTSSFVRSDVALQSVTGSFTVKGFDLVLGNGDQVSRGNSGTSRAIVKGSANKLFINYANDFNGGIVLNSDTNVTGNLTVSNNTVWHAGNMGSGSGLNADMLDGIHVSSLLRTDASDTATGNLTFTNGLSIGNDLYMGGNSIVFSSSNGPFSGYASGNVDHIYFDDTTNTFHFAADSTYKGSVSNSIVNAGSFTANGNTVWHAGNMGSGSGLDADTVDGIQGGDIVRLSQNNTLLGDNIIDGNSGSLEITNSNWSTHKFKITGVAPNISFNQTDAGYNWQVGTNGNAFYILKDSNQDGFHDSVPYAFQLDGTLLKVYGNTVYHTANINNSTTDLTAKDLTLAGNLNMNTDGQQIKFSNGLGDVSYIRNTSGSSLDIGSDAEIKFYETDSEVAAVVISTNDKTVTASGGFIGTATNASKLDNYSIGDGASTVAGTAFIPLVRSDSVMEIGRYIDFHSPVGDGIDFVTRLEGTSTGLIVNTSTGVNGTVWHSGNDGAGSGLDADKIDGVQLSQLVRNDTTNGGTVKFGTIDIASRIYFEDSKHSINVNDGSGNFNIKVGVSSDANLLCTEAGYSSHWTFNQANGRWDFKASSSSNFVGEGADLRTVAYLDKDGNFDTIGNVTATNIDSMETRLTAVEDYVSSTDVAALLARIEALEAQVAANTAMTFANM